MNKINVNDQAPGNEKYIYFEQFETFKNEFLT